MRRSSAVPATAVAVALISLLGGLLPPTAVPAFAAAPAAASELGLLEFAGGPPSAADLAAVRTLGIRAQGLVQLPYAVVSGPRSLLESAVGRTAAVRFWPDRQLRAPRVEPAAAEATAGPPPWHEMMGVDRLHARGLTGKGTTIAIVDTGLDATHPDLADHVTHNFEVVAAPGASPLVLDVRDAPYSDTDKGGGHGTHVAGIAAADGTTDPAHVGVAPDAELVGYSVITPLGNMGLPRIVAAYDHILSHPELGVDAVNNSFGYPPGVFDPSDPVHVATRSLAEAGIVVLFAAGNFGDDEAEGTLSSLAVAPWVIGVASADLDGRRSAFSSSGWALDNSAAVEVAAGHVAFEGDRLGLYHPSVTAPGGGIRSSCGPSGGCEPGGTTTSAGTSMAAPQVAGLAALLLQARPGLRPDQVKQAVEATAGPATPPAPFWQIGYGAVDAAAAADLVERGDFAEELERQHLADEQRVAAEDSARVLRSDIWHLPQHGVALAEAAPGVHEVQVPVSEQVGALRVTLSYLNQSLVMARYRVRILDAQRREVGRTTGNWGAFEGSWASRWLGLESATVPVWPDDVVYGTWTLQVAASYEASTYTNPRFTLRVAQVAAADGAPSPAEPGPPRIALHEVASSEAGATVTGTATFGRTVGPVDVGGTRTASALGGSPAGEAMGLGLTDASISRVPRGLQFTWRVSQMPPIVPPEGVRYTWFFTLGGRRYGIFATRTHLANPSNVTQGPVESAWSLPDAHFGLQLNGVPYPTQQLSSYQLASLDGHIDVADRRITVTLPYETRNRAGLVVLPDFKPGSLLLPDPVGLGIDARPLNYNPALSTTSVQINGWNPYFVGPQFALALGSEGADPAALDYSITVAAEHDGSFTATLAGLTGGNDTVYARACNATTCTYTSRRATDA